MKDESKRALFCDGLLCLIFFVLFSILFFASASAKKRQIAAIASSIHAALDNSAAKGCTVGENVPIPSAFNSQTLLFALSSKNSDFLYAALVRATGFSGAMPILLLYSEKSGISSEGILFDGGQVKNSAECNVSDFSVEDAKRRLAKILAEVESK